MKHLRGRANNDHVNINLVPEPARELRLGVIPFEVAPGARRNISRPLPRVKKTAKMR